MEASAAPTAASTHHQLAEEMLFHALASSSQTSVSSTVSTTTATPMTTQRSHQYLPREGPSWLRASLAGASWDTPYRVAAQVPGPLLCARARRIRRCRGRC